MTTDGDIHQIVRDRYAAAATQVSEAGGSGCCGGSGGCEPVDPISRDLYAIEEVAEVPEAAVLASLGCGNPTALAELHEGEVVLDLGSGGGIDVLLSARRVGATGHAYGVDMTDEMLDLARSNAQQAGATNVDFLKGSIDAIPLPDESVDVIISNCVINLAADKSAVLAEAFRVLRPGPLRGVRRRGTPGAAGRPAPLDGARAGCIAGALTESEFLRLLGEAGFEEVSIVPTREYTREDARVALSAAGLDLAGSGLVEGALVRCVRPSPSSGC